MNYQVADRVVASDMALPELSAVASACPHWRFEVRPPEEAPRRSRPFHFWKTPRGARTAFFARAGDCVVTHFARTATFVTDYESHVVACHPQRRSRPESIRAALVNQMIPLLLGEERLVLHASAVAARDGAVVFVGPPGHGKSTLATALALGGLPLITDDFLVIDHHDGRPVAMPSGVAPRLWPDSVTALFASGTARFPRIGPGSAKRRIRAVVPVASGAVPIDRVFILDGVAPRPLVERATGATVVAALTAATFVSRIDERSVVRRAFEQATSLAGQVPAQRLVLEPDLAGLQRSCDVIRDTLA